MSNPALSKAVVGAIESKVGGVASLGILWKTEIFKAFALGAEEEGVIQLVAAFSAPLLLGRFLVEHGRAKENLNETLARMLKDCDELGVRFDEFATGIEYVLRYLGSNNRHASPSKVVGYVYCAAEFIGQKSIEEPLGDTVHGMLERYGFDG